MEKETSGGTGWRKRLQETSCATGWSGKSRISIRRLRLQNSILFPSFHRGRSRAVFRRDILFILTFLNGNSLLRVAHLLVVFWKIGKRQWPIGSRRIREKIVTCRRKRL
ncbi:unnamed protein product [Microthlaspi erraticum]|uniref:Uncharacterized protein n=1 Tax=Microthlaspi erraticum TaxID=1685480 RepID=A0A6D2KMT8_9BRAS|nr:unnamed protein product [Microthlaspi erraticum]CAA7053259.1 unnamed protein product [Microthlaspi erraticum]CAA7053261.1 unnamed protein product [Microthlaspi erraticum]CAA7053263.1 unnamed protein product [Microthlaspi erraticum]CAA7056809.1 unnamed protein product [Microthlaspi erraticum]